MSLSEYEHGNGRQQAGDMLFCFGVLFVFVFAFGTLLGKIMAWRRGGEGVFFFFFFFFSFFFCIISVLFNCTFWTKYVCLIVAVTMCVYYEFVLLLFGYFWLCIVSIYCEKRRG